MPLTALEIQERQERQEEYKSISYVIDRDNDYNGFMLFIAIYDYAILDFSYMVNDRYELELLVSLIYDEILRNIYFNIKEEEENNWFGQVIAYAERLDNKSATILFTYLSSTVFVFGVDEEEEEEQKQKLTDRKRGIEYKEERELDNEEPEPEPEPEPEQEPNKRPREIEKTLKPLPFEMEVEFEDHPTGITNNWWQGWWPGGKRTRRLPPRPKTRKNNKKISNKTRSMSKPKTRKNNKKRSHKKRSAPKRKTVKKR